MVWIKNIAIVYSESLWNTMDIIIRNVGLRDEDVKRFTAFKNSHIKTITSDTGSGQVLCIYENIERENTNYNSWFSAHDYHLDSFNWKMIRIWEDDASSLGSLHNDFGINYQTKYELVLNDKYKTLSPTSSVKLNNSTPAINNHTCVRCGNTKCSKSETVCWKCGHNPH